MKKVLYFIFIIALFSCSSDETESKVINSQTVTLSDIKGKWEIVSATSSILNGVRLVLDDNSSCCWSDKYGNDFVGPYYYLENVNDNTLKEQCALIGSNIKNKIHIGDIKVINYPSGNSELRLPCDLMPLLPDLKWQDFAEKVDKETWYFWEGNSFSYIFEITNYTNESMILKLSNSDVRYCDYESKYPLRLDNGTTVNLRRL